MDIINTINTINIIDTIYTMDTTDTTDITKTIREDITDDIGSLIGEEITDANVMDKLVKNIKRIENSVARYIFNKYINPHIVNTPENAIDAGDIGDTPDILESESVSKKQHKAMQKAIQKAMSKEMYKIYLKTIFNIERKSRILQEDVIKKDIIDMDIATKAYEINPDNFKTQDYSSLPDVLRCTFIRKIKHRYYRCKLHVINADADICKLHENSDNIYFDKYNDLLENR